MKTSFIIAVSALILCACRHEGKYVDLRTGERIDVVKDDSTGYMVNSETRKPVYLYVEPATHDTFYGRTGVKISGKVLRSPDGVYSYNDEEYTFKDSTFQKKPEEKVISVNGGDVKIKVDDAGKIKIKGNDKKIKIKDGKVKIKDR